MNGLLSVDRRHFLAASAAAAIIKSSGAAAQPSGKANRIRVGQIGVGHGHATKLSVYRASPDYEVVGIVEPDEALRKKAENQPPYRDLPWMTREQLLNSPGLQAVLVETRVRDGLATAEACIAAGKHVHLDKPAGESLPRFAQLLDAARRRNLMVQLGYMYRYNPGILLLKEMMRQGWLGDLFELHTVMSKVLSPPDRIAQAEYTGGMMFELGCHILDLTIGILGAPQSIHAVRQHVSPLNDALLDNMLAVLTYPKAMATVKSSAQEVEGNARRHLVVCGTGGTFHLQPLDSPAARAAFSERRGDYTAKYQDISFPKFERYVADAADMARVIRGEKPNDFTYDHELAVQRAVLEASGLPLT